MADCGTPGGYQAHLAAGEETCLDCRAAIAAKQKRWRDQGGNASVREQGRARQRAIQTLIERHRDEYDKLYRDERMQDRVRKLLGVD